MSEDWTPRPPDLPRTAPKKLPPPPPRSGTQKTRPGGKRHRTIPDMPVTTAADIVVAVPEEEDLGPKMRALTPARRAFCIAYLELGGRNGVGAKACELAGLGGTLHSRQVMASVLLRHPAVIDALHELSKDFTGDAILARAKLRVLMDCDDPLVALKASVEILNRAHPVTKQVHVTVEHDNRSNDELLKDIEAAQARIRLLAPPKEISDKIGQLNAEKTAPIDAEFAEVKEAA